MGRLPREFWASTIIVWSAVLITALVMAVPYWAGGHTWLIHSGRVFPMMTVALLGARVLYTRRYGSNAEIAARYSDMTRRQKLLGTLLLVVGLTPGIVLIVVVTMQAGITNP